MSETEPLDDRVSAVDGTPPCHTGDSSSAGVSPSVWACEGSWPRAGVRAVLRGLEKFPRFNGQVVDLLCFDEVNERWRCLLPNGGDVKVRAENLAPAPGGEGPPLAPRCCDPREAALQRAERLLAKGRAYEARLLLSAAAGGLPPAAESPLAGRFGGPRWELVEDRLELVDIPGRGKGYRAARRLTRGDVLLFDTALVSGLVGPSSNEDLARQCRQLKDGDVMAEVLALEPGGGAQGKGLLQAVLGNNVFECTREPGRVALFTSTARFNHSCCPSAYVDATRSECVVRALRDVDEGEEVCVSYVPVSDSCACRRGALRAWGIECTCERCAEELGMDPQLAVPCQCGAASFSVQEGARAYQTCKRCASAFDREEALHNLSKVSEMNAYLGGAAASAADPRELLGRLASLEALVLPGATNGVPPMHSASMLLLNHLANLHHHVAVSGPGPPSPASTEQFVRCKALAIEAFEAKHSKWTHQRDVDFFQILQGFLACEDLAQECRARWSQVMAEACQLCFGQQGLPASLSPSARK